MQILVCLTSLSKIILMATVVLVISCGDEDGNVYCCKYCDARVSKPCGDTCISKEYDCTKVEGCACYM